MASLSVASAYPYAQAPGPAGLAYPKAGPNGHYDAKHYFQVCTNLHLQRNRVALQKIKIDPPKNLTSLKYVFSPYLYFAYVSKLNLP
jgi:hypothetical protein